MNFADKSGTITAGGTAQTLAKQQPGRKVLLIQNTSAGDLWFNEGTAAILASPSIRLGPGDTIFLDTRNAVPEGPISIIGATTAQTFTAKVG